MLFNICGIVASVGMILGYYIGKNSKTQNASDAVGNSESYIEKIKNDNKYKSEELDKNMAELDILTQAENEEIAKLNELSARIAELKNKINNETSGEYSQEIFPPFEGEEEMITKENEADEEKTENKEILENEEINEKVDNQEN